VDFAAADLAACHAAVADGDPSSNDSAYLRIHGDSYRRLLLQNAGAYSASVIKRDVFIAAGGVPPALTCADDWTLFLNVARLVEWHTLEKRLAFCRVHALRSTASADNARAILAAHLNVWYGGRAVPGHAVTTRDALDTALREYQPAYGRLVQDLLWSSIRARRWRLARDVRRLGRPLILGRWRWWSIQLPRRITGWRTRG
jgi:hypothetical protein